MGPTKPLLLAALVAMCAAAAEASSAPAPTLFRLSISGTGHAEWDHTGVPFPFEGCQRTVRSEGIRDVRFRTATPAIVRVLDARVLAATVRRLTGTVTLGGANTTSDACGGEGRQVIADCAQTTRTFGTATLGVRGRRPGSFALRPLRNVRLPASTCPREPAEVVRAPLGPIPRSFPVSIALLARKRVARITLTAARSGTVTYGPRERGTLRHNSAWKLTLRRVS